MCSPMQGKMLRNYENRKDVRQVNILCQVQVAGKYGFENSVPTNFQTVSGFIVFSNKMLRDRESESGV